MPYETPLYVPKIIAVSVAAKNAAPFGLENVKPDPAVTFDSLPVPSGVSTKTIATAAGVDVASLEALRPHLKAGRKTRAAPRPQATERRVCRAPGERARRGTRTRG